MKLITKMFAVLASMLLLSSAFAQDFTIDPAASQVHWKGTKVGGGHDGNLGIQSGKLVLKDGALVGGEVVVDMNKMTNLDLSGEWADKLIGHLKNDDFFAVDKHPTSKIVFNKVTAVKGGKYKIEGSLTVKSITKPITFEASISQDGNSVKGESELKFNRAEYDVRYNSGKFFKDLGDKLIHDDIQLKVTLTAKK